MSSTFSSRSRLPLFAAAALLALSDASAESKMTFGGAGWLGYGSIVSSTPLPGDPDLSGKSLISSGAQIVLGAEVSERLDIAAGVGVGGGHVLVGSVATLGGGYAPYGQGPYVAQANFTLHGWKDEDKALFLRGGLFAYDYAPENQNLGLYMLRGPVYPGYVISGFETKHVLPVANTLGLQLHHQSGAFSHDLMLPVETEFSPFYDVSLVYVAAVQAGSALRIGAGVNFAHAISVDNNLTKDTLDVKMKWIDTSTTPDDTVQLSARGVKLMFNAALDIKALVGGMDALGPEDLKIYTEVGLFGLRNAKVDKELYGGYANRMPKMVGINLPTFKLLDRLAIEVEHYTAPFPDDLGRYNHTKRIQSPLVPMDEDSTYTKDDLKWSIYASKVVHNHIKISVQAASDHFRPGVFAGYGDNYPAGSRVPFYRPQDWYWMSKIAYFF